MTIFLWLLVCQFGFSALLLGGSTWIAYREGDVLAVRVGLACSAVSTAACLVLARQL